TRISGTETNGSATVYVAHSGSLVNAPHAPCPEGVAARLQQPCTVSLESRYGGQSGPHPVARAPPWTPLCLIGTSQWPRPGLSLGLSPIVGLGSRQQKR
ncbi:MAG: hypothetical protein MUF54_06290, partial [Polyangiaceae bacterium]|nr:hypothetical protein [Polyangiaceae bacterium]